jgi:hypothetical protein
MAIGTKTPIMPLIQYRRSFSPRSNAAERAVPFVNAFIGAGLSIVSRFVSDHDFPGEYQGEHTFQCLPPEVYYPRRIAFP